MSKRFVVKILCVLGLIFVVNSCATPYGIYHKTKENDTLYSLSLQYKINVDKLAQLNNMKPDESLKPGQYLFIPGISALEGEPEKKAAPLKKKKEEDVSGKNAFAKTHAKDKKQVDDKDVNFNSQFIWPADGIVSSQFGVRDGAMHEGIDIGLPEGRTVIASADGKVIFAGDHGGYGLVVIIQHEDNFFTVYAHNSKLFVKEAQKVKKGEKISLSGKTGKASGPHLHFEIRKESKPLDPLKFLPKPEGKGN